MAEMKCNVCKKKIENLNDYVRIADGTVCKACWEKAGFGFFAQFGAGNYTSEKIKSLIYKRTKSSKEITRDDTKNATKNISKTKETELKKTTNQNKNTGKVVATPKPTIMEQIDTMEGIEFENYIKKLLEQMGYSSVQTTATTGDQGVDLLAKKGMTKYAIQCKRYKGNVGNKAVQEVFSGAFFYKCDKCMVVTNSHFTNSAKELAKANKVELWDRDKLQEFVEKYGKR